MVEQTEISRWARTLSKERRKGILTSFQEKELHEHLRELLSGIEPNYLAEITHGREEYGKDLVLVKEDRFGRTALGVVVKTGNIGGRTAGRVDEIKSQVEQAFAHPATLREIFEDLSISEVWIVLAGELSGNANKRLKAELKDKSIKVFDINWLIDKFTEYYPQVFFEGKLIDFLQKKIQELERKHLFSKRGKNLSECFVEPVVAAIDVPMNFDEEHLTLIVQKRRMPFLQLNSILRPGEKIILAGDPGTGKSAALAKMAIDRLREASELMLRGISGKQRIKIPILVSTKEILESSNCETLKAEYFQHAELLDRFEADVLAIDGLDEALPSQRKDILEKAEKFSRQFNCALIITTRKVNIIKSLPARFRSYELLPFEFGRALKLFEKLVSEKQILGALREGLEKVKSQIPMVPLSLLLLIELAEDYKEIPASVTELYQRFCDLMLGRWDKDKGIKVLFEYFMKERFLAELAFKEFLQKETLTIPQKEFNEFLNDYASRYGWREEDAGGFVREIVERSGIISIREEVTFWHRSFLDYFGACYINDKREQLENLNDFIVQIYFDDMWGDVAFFYAGLRREIDNSILEKIFAIESDDLATLIGKFVAGRLLQAAWHSPITTKHFGIQKAVSFAPIVRDAFLEVTAKHKATVPKIYADLLVMVLSDFSFSSGFLVKEAKEVFNELSSQPSPYNHTMMLSLLWATQRLLDQNELRAMIDQVLESLSKVDDLEEQAKTFLLLRIIEHRDEAIRKMIKRKLDKLQRRRPDVFRSLLPPGQKGFRRRKTAA